MRTLLVSMLLPLAVAAQIPTNSILVLESTTTLNASNYHIVDALGGGSASVRNQSVFMLPSPASVAVDPVAPDLFYFEASTTTLPGTWRTQVGLLGAIGQSTWGPWFQTPGARIEIGATHFFRVRQGNVEWCGRTPGLGSPAVLFPLSNAVDLAVLGSRVWAASSSVAPAPLVEYDTATATQRVVGNYVGVLAIAVSPVAPELCLGLQNGDLVRIDIATGAVIATTPTGLGPIVAVGYTRFGTLVWADATQLWSELVPSGPVWVSGTSIVDFGIGVAPTASVTPFGAGCGLGAATDWFPNSLPVQGNLGFALGLGFAPANSFALLAFGNSRYFSASLGALPISLQGIGAPGCELLVDPQVLLLQPTNAIGAASQGIPIPFSPALAGVEFVGQWFVLDAGVGALGLAGTAGVAFVVQ